jgi:hypothetical protein
VSVLVKSICVSHVSGKNLKPIFYLGSECLSSCIGTDVQSRGRICVVSPILSITAVLEHEIRCASVLVVEAARNMRHVRSNLRKRATSSRASLNKV